MGPFTFPKQQQTPVPPARPETRGGSDDEVERPAKRLKTNAGTAEPAAGSSSSSKPIVTKKELTAAAENDLGAGALNGRPAANGGMENHDPVMMVDGGENSRERSSSSPKKRKKKKKKKKHKHKKKRRRRDSDGEDDSDVDDYDDEDDDGGVDGEADESDLSDPVTSKRPASKALKQSRLDSMPKMLKKSKPQKGRARFYDVEAEMEDDEHAVSDSDEDLEAEEEEALLGREGFTFGGLDDLVASDDEVSEDEIGFHERLDRERDQAEVDTAVSQLEERARKSRMEARRARELMRQRFQTGGGGVTGAPGVVPLSELMPQIHDPKLFLVRCKPGKESECVLRIIRHVFMGHGSQRPGAQKFISSVFSQTGATGKGFIFVEAPKKDHVTQALQGLGNSSNGLNPYSARVVPINQMIQAVTVSTDHVLLKPRDFVRIKRGLYKGDPGMVVGTSDHGTQVMVKLVPRLDLVELEMQQDQNVLAEKPKRGAPSSADRPEPKLLDLNQLRELMPRDVQARSVRGTIFHAYKSGLYRHGFLYKTYPLRSLFTTEEEWQASGGAAARRRAAAGGGGGGDGPPVVPSTARRRYRGSQRRGIIPESDEYQLFLQRMRDSLDSDDEDSEDEDDHLGSREGSPDVKPHPLVYYRTGKLPEGWDPDTGMVLKTEGGGQDGTDAGGGGAGVGGTDVSGLEAAMPELAIHSDEPITFLQGDTVVVIKGDLKGFKGTVVSELQGKVRMKPLDKRMEGQLLDFEPHELDKFFQLGDHVKVLRGEFAGETGLVVGLTPHVTVHGDSNQTTMKIPRAGDLTKTAEVSSGRSALGSYQLYDLVMCRDAQSTVGCVVKVELSTLRILTTRGQLKSVKLQDIARKLHNTNTRNAMSGYDSRNQPISPGDPVVVEIGEYRGKHGTVKHIFRGFVYLYSPSHHQNSGMFVVLGKQVRLKGAAAGRMGGVMGAGGMPAPFMGGRGGGPGGGGVAGGLGGNRDPLMRQNVVITKGQYKGLQGLVVNCKPTTVRVEIPALMKTIAFNRADVQELSSVSRGGVAGLSSRTTARSRTARSARDLGGETPAHLLGGKTPGPAELGSQTPFMDGGMTPSTHMMGGMTPGPGVFSAETPGPHDVWSAQTPHHTGSRGMVGAKDDFQEDEEEDRHGSSPPLFSAMSAADGAAAARGSAEDMEDADFRATTGLPPAAVSSSSSSSEAGEDASSGKTAEAEEGREQDTEEQATSPEQLALPPGTLVLYRPEGAAAGVDDQEAVVIPPPDRKNTDGDGDDGGTSGFVRITMTGEVLEPKPDLIRVLPVQAGQDAILLEPVSDTETGQPGLQLETGARVSCVSVDEATQQAVCSYGEHTLFLPLAKLGRWQDPNQ